MTAASEGSRPGEAVLVLADDLIWATRLEGQLRTLGATPVRLRTAEALDAELTRPAPPGRARPARAVVDLGGRSYDGIGAVAAAAAAGLHVLGVGQHDDPARRAAARAAGATQVHTYRALFERGHAVLAAWLGVAVPAPGAVAAPGAR